MERLMPVIILAGFPWKAETGCFPPWCAVCKVQKLQISSESYVTARQRADLRKPIFEDTPSANGRALVRSGRQVVKNRALLDLRNQSVFRHPIK